MPFSNTLFHQLQAPVLRYAYVDPAYWLMHLMQIPDVIVSNFKIAYFFDVLLFASCIASVIYPLQKWLIALFLLVYFIYIVTINSYGTHHTHAGVAILLAPIPFLFKNKINFSLMWNALRYYTLFIYADAFVWKFFRLTWLNWNQGISILKNNLAAYVYFNSNTTLAHFYKRFLQHPFYANILFIIGFILEGTFIIGFFTKKFDKYLMLASFILIAGFWFMADALFFELAILNLTLIRHIDKKSIS